MNKEIDLLDSSDVENSDSSSDEDDNSELVAKAEELEKQIASNNYLYDAHVEIVDLYRQLGDLNSMREAYQRFQNCFPLTPKLWLAWLRDEIKIASTPIEQNHVIELFDKAVEDYLSVELWMEYAQYSIGINDTNATRSILERGLNAVGLDVSKGSLLWDTLREFEHAHLSSAPQNTDEWKIQVNRLVDVFKRQLSVPLFGLEEVHQEWRSWFESLPENTVDPKPIEWGYKKALATLQTYKPFEEKILVAENNDELFNVFKDYIKIVNDPSTVLCLYERAAVTLCLVPELWLDYCLYAFKLGESALKINDRALRNCPWSEDLWVTRLRILENLKRDESEVLVSFEKGLASLALNSGLDLWIAYLEFAHRNVESDGLEKLNKLFKKAVEQTEHLDGSCKLLRWQARILAGKGDMASARKTWGSILKCPQNKGLASVWLEYGALERQYGESNQLRTLFQKALNACRDWPQCVSEEWLMYEREFGTLETMLKCLEKIKSVSVPKLEAESMVVRSEAQENRSKNVFKGVKRKNDEFERFDNKKRSKNIEKTDSNVGKMEEKPAIINKPIEKDPKRTVFVSNLHPSIDENQLKELFSNASLIDLVYDRKGKSRCYGYVHFEKEEEALTALARDRVPLDGRPVFISEVKPEKTERKPVFKYAATTETNKLFVRDLPKTKTKEDVEQIFKPLGAVDVRLVLRRNGQPKGLAYVEFENEAAAKKALIKTDQTQVEDNVITVAISAPPRKGEGSTGFRQNEPLRQPRSHARSRLQVPLIPRAVQSKSVESVNKGSANGAETGGKASGIGSGSKSNADFRNMLFNK